MRETFNWRPSRRGGALGPLATYTADAADLDFAHDLYRAVLLFSPGSPERTRRINEVRFLLDALALVEARLVDSPSKARPAVDVGARIREEAAAIEETDPEPIPEDGQLDLLEGAGLHSWRRIPEGEWAILDREAHKKDGVSDAVAWTRRWNPKMNLVGVVGEWLFSELTGLERKRGFGDGGRDFGDVDVKASSHARPRLLRLASDPLKAARYALVAVDLEGRSARYVGYALRDEVAQAPVREYGYGPTRTLFETDLHPELPAI